MRYAGFSKERAVAAHIKHSAVTSEKEPTEVVSEDPLPELEQPIIPDAAPVVVIAPDPVVIEPEPLSEPIVIAPEPEPAPDPIISESGLKAVEVVETSKKKSEPKPASVPSKKAPAKRKVGRPRKATSKAKKNSTKSE